MHVNLFAISMATVIKVIMVIKVTNVVIVNCFILLQRLLVILISNEDDYIDYDTDVDD